MREARYREAEARLFEDAGVEPTERWLALPRLGTRARVLLTGDGPPLVFFHGGPDAGATWAYLAAALPGFRCHLVDRPGCGLSEPPRSLPDRSTLPAYVADLAADVLDALELERAGLVGCSFGGYASLRAAMAHPDRVASVVLTGCPAFVPGWTPPSFAGVLRTPLVGRLLLAAPPTKASVRFSLRQFGHRRSLDSQRIPAAMLDWIRAWQRDTDTMRNDARMILACGRWPGGFDPGLDLTPEELGAVRAPCLIVSGADDPVGGAEVTGRLASLLPDALIDVWDGAGHLPWLDDPRRGAAAVSGFAHVHP
jgi:2-hydroxy-6-oxonona-2,4-dienedioate hydrolase